MAAGKRVIIAAHGNLIEQIRQHKTPGTDLPVLPHGAHVFLHPGMDSG